MEHTWTRRGLAWQGVDAPRMEYADVVVHDGAMVATGCQIGVEPEPYSVRYELRLDAAGVAPRLVAVSRTASRRRELRVHRDGTGHWSWGYEAIGAVPDEPPAENPGPIQGALDLDLGYSPLFNSTPVLRDGLLREDAEARDYLMAWVSVPDLSVTPSRQRYEPLGHEGDLRMIRYTSLDSGFTAKIAFDPDGFVVDYEGFLARVATDRGPDSPEVPIAAQ